MAVETKPAQPIDDQRIRGADQVAIAPNQVKRSQIEMIGMARENDQSLKDSAWEFARSRPLAPDMKRPPSSKGSKNTGSIRKVVPAISTSTDA